MLMEEYRFRAQQMPEALNENHKASAASAGYNWTADNTGQRKSAK